LLSGGFRRFISGITLIHKGHLHRFLHFRLHRLRQLAHLRSILLVGGGHCITGTKRSITVPEAARLQSFDGRFIFHGYETDQERHVGNAVPPLLSKALAVHFGKLVCSA